MSDGEGDPYGEDAAETKTNAGGGEGEVDAEELASRISIDADTIEKKDRDILRDIARSTKVPLTELERLLFTFKKVSADGEGAKHRLDVEGFESLFGRVLKKSFGSNSSALSRILFEAFDLNDTGYVEYHDFLAGLSLLAPTGREERVKFAFSCFDLNNNGRVSKYEVFQFARSFFFASLDILDYLVSHFGEVFGDPSTIDERLIEAMAVSNLEFNDMRTTFETLGGLFDCMDVDGEGVITMADVHALEAMKILKEEDIKMMFEMGHTPPPPKEDDEEEEEERGIDFNMGEFFACFANITRKITEPEMSAKAKESFSEKVRKLRSFYKELERTFEYMDLDGKGSLSFEEFSRWTKANPAVMKWLDQMDNFLDQVAVDPEDGEEDEGWRSRSMPAVGSDQSTVHFEVSDISADTTLSFDALEGVTREEKLAAFDVDYLRQNVFPALLPALEELLRALERRKEEMDKCKSYEIPPRPINSRRFIAQYLMRNNPKYDTKKFRTNVPPASKRLLDRLLKKTNFLRIELRDLYGVFKRVADRDGVITKARFADALVMLEPYGLSPDVTGTQMEGRIFDVFDRDRNGVIDMSEFVCALSMLTKGDPKERSRIAFDMVDKDRMGRVGRKEISLFLKHTLQTPHYLAHKTVHDTFGEELADYVTDEKSLVGEFTDLKIKSMVDLAFQQMKVTSDGLVGFEEFYQWRTDQEMIKNAMANIEPLFWNLRDVRD